jgi:TetR/AcrR family transcriptional regulator, transcriptional repressor for nem operon
VPRTGRPRSFDGDGVLNAATEIFWRRGYTATSLRDVTERVDVLPGSLYAAFGDKHSFFLRALERYADGTRDVAISLTGDGPVLPRVAALLHSVLAAARVAPGRGCMLGNTATELLPDDEAIAAVVRRAFRTLEHALEHALSVGQKNGEIREEIDCGAQARHLLVVVQGLHVVARAEPDPDRLSDAVDAVLASLIETRSKRRRTARNRAAKR